MTCGNRLRRTIWILPLIGAIAAGGARAAEGPDWDVARLMQSMASVKSSRSTFVERKEIAILSAPLVSSGTLLFRSPDYLEKRTLLPRESSLVLDGDRLTLDEGEAGGRRTVELQAYPVIRAFVEGVRATLAGDLGALSRHYRVTLDGHRAAWRLTLRPVEPEMRELVKVILIDGTDNRIRAMEILESSGDRSVMSVAKDAR